MARVCTRVYLQTIQNLKGREIPRSILGINQSWTGSS